MTPKSIHARQDDWTSCIIVHETREKYKRGEEKTDMIAGLTTEQIPLPNASGCHPGEPGAASAADNTRC